MESPNEIMIEKKQSKNILGILSVVFAGIALIGSWIPIFNIISMVFAFVAMVLGIISLVFVITKRTTLLPLPIIGMSVSLISLILAFGVNVFVFNSASSSSSVSGTIGSIISGADNKEYKVGETVTLNNHALTVTNVQRDYSTGNKYMAPGSGNEFIKVTVKLENKSSGNINVNSYDFKVQDGGGSAGYPKSATYALDDKFDSAQLAPGGSKTGSLVFEVPKGDQNLKLIYRLSSVANKQIDIKL